MNKIVRIENLIDIHLANKYHLVLLLSSTKNAFVKIIPSLNACMFSGRAQSVHEPHKQARSFLSVSPKLCNPPVTEAVLYPGDTSLNEYCQHSYHLCTTISNRDSKKKQRV